MATDRPPRPFNGFARCGDDYASGSVCLTPRHARARASTPQPDHGTVLHQREGLLGRQDAAADARAAAARCLAARLGARATRHLAAPPSVLAACRWIHQPRPHGGLLDWQAATTTVLAAVLAARLFARAGTRVAPRLGRLTAGLASCVFASSFADGRFAAVLASRLTARLPARE